MDNTFNNRTDNLGRQFWRFFREFVLPYRLAAFLLVLNIVVRTGLGLFMPYANKTIVDSVLVAKAPDLRLLGMLLLAMLGVILANQGLVFLFRRLQIRLVVFINAVMRDRLAKHMLKLEQGYYDVSHMGRLLVTAIGDPSAVANQLTAAPIDVLANTLVLAGSYVILLSMSPPLTLAISLVFPLMAAAFLFLRPRMREMSVRSRESWGILSGMVSEKVSAVRLVRSFAAEDLEAARFGARARLHAGINIEQARVNILYGFFNGLFIHLGYMIVFGAGGWLYLKGRVSLGTVVAFYFYFNSLFPAVQQLCNVPQALYSAKGSLNKVFALLDKPAVIQSADSAPDFRGPLKEVRFRDVSFRYGEHLPWVLRHLDLVVPAGESLGILGPSGSGKSTLMALLLRFYEPNEGQVLVNGRDIKEWNLKSLRRAMALVPQEIVLFSGTIRGNVLYSWEKRTDSEIWQALKDAAAEDFVRGMAFGLNTVVGERGISLSGGQRQRLSIARALLTSPQALILDNCTSALDGGTEQRLHAALREKLKGRTSFIISHRVSSVEHCSRVLVMDSGRVVEQGSVAELKSVPGYFAGIWAQQAAL